MKKTKHPNLRRQNGLFRGALKSCLLGLTAAASLAQAALYTESFTAGDTDLSVAHFGWTAYNQIGTDLSISTVDPLRVPSASLGSLLFVGSLDHSGKSYALISDATTINSADYENLEISFADNSSDDGTQQPATMGYRVVARVGSDIYASDFISRSAGTRVTNVLLVKNTIWNLWTGENDLSDGFDIADISTGSATTLSGLISDMGLVVTDGSDDNDRLRVDDFSIIATIRPLQKRNYSYMYYQNGFGSSDPDLVFQAGYYSLMLDCDTMQLKGYDALAGSDYRTALDQDVSVFTPATSFLLRVQQGGVFYTCTSAVVQDSSGNHVRLVESGQYVKRIDHLGLVFKDSGGNTMVADSDCRLEMSAWPDRVTFFLDFSSETINPITRTTIQVVSPDGITHLKDLGGNQARLTIKPQDDVTLSALNVNDTILEATNLQDGSALNVTFDEDVHAFHIDVPANGISYPADIDRVDEYFIEVINSSAVAENIPLVFEQPSVRAITGTVMLLCDAEDGRPLGIPVQISKNWHSDGSPHSGSWLRGSTMLTLQPGESRWFKLRVIYGYWGGAGAISHAQLSLIGWGGNWKWDDSALGAWGESLTYDPTMHVSRAFMADIRPTFTTSLGGGQHSWTENVGGGDFLIYRDSANNKQNLKRQKTCYLQTGPNLTEVLYTGVSDDDKIRATYTSLGVSTLDYHRRFHHYKYEFLQDVVAPQRLVFHQMAAEQYFKTSFDDYYIGDETGVSVSGTIEAGGNVYKGSPISFDGKWLSIDDTWTSANGGNPVWVMRGIIPLSSTLNGSAFPLYMHKYGRTWGDGNTMLFDFSSDSVSRSYSAGDVVEGEYELILPPQHVDNYWGGDAELINRLTVYGDTAWEPVRDEFVHNVQMGVVVHQGTLMNNYPLEIQPQTNNRVLADFTVNGGGIGHVPVLLENADAGQELTVQRWANGVWSDLGIVDLDKNSYYQAVQNPDGTMDYTFSIPRPSLDLNEAWRVRIYSKPVVFVASQASFEGGFDGWINRTDGDFDWVRKTGGTTSLSTGPDGATDGTYYLYTEASDPNYPSKIAVISNRVDFSSYASMDMEFDYHMYGADMGSLHVDVFDGAVWHTDVWSISGQQQTSSTDSWATATVNLTPYIAGGAIDVQFRGITGTSWRSDMALDNIRFRSPFESVDFGKWASDFGLVSADAAADPDGDTIVNFEEYVFGGNPMSASDFGYLPIWDIFQEDNGINYLEYVYVRWRNADARGLHYQLESTSNLVDSVWNTGEVEEVDISIINSDFESVTSRIFGGPQHFLRLRVEQQ